jgi:hypothetical protein
MVVGVTIWRRWQQQQQKQQQSLSQNDYTKKKANNFTSKGNYELLLRRLQMCGRFDFISQRARTVFYSILTGKSRPPVTKSFLVPPHFPSNFKCSKMKVTLNVGLVMQDLRIGRSVHPKNHLWIVIDGDFRSELS